MTTFSLIEQRRIEAARLQAQQAQILRDLAQDTTLDQAASIATAPGDTRKLRGIPAIGRGVAGAVPGTQPERAAIANLMREPRGGHDGRRAGTHGRKPSQHNAVTRWIT